MTVGILFVTTLQFVAFVQKSHAVDVVFIPQGEFLMGTPAGTDSFDDEHPQRKIFVSAFWIDRYEVTNEAYERFVRDRTSHS
jgi:formylglycine-generating enzyme required for sulfatase activity